MFRQIGSRASFLCLCIAAVFLWAGPAVAQHPQAVRAAQANTSDVSEKEAFEAAKELGTIEAWEAFLTNFPKGFRADLARAYVRRLGSGQEKPEATPAPAPQPAPQQPQQAATPPPPPAPPLPPVDMGPGTSPWRMGTYTFDGGSTTPAAIVDARGVRLSAYCTAQRAIQFVISDKRDGVFPEFDRRIEQGFSAAGGDTNAANKANIPIVFRDGQQVFVQASVHGLTGELALGDTDSGFGAASPILEQIMAGNAMTVSMPPFGATFQLNGSRNAMCSLLRSCGAAGAQSGCAPPAPAPAASAPVARPPVRNANCTAGQVFSRKAGRCVCPRSAPFFFGGRCRATRDCPGDSVLNSRGQCVKENEPPRQFTPQQVDTCPGDSVRNAQGICVKENEPPPQNNAQKLQCGMLQIACAAGNQNACNNMASACR